MPIAAALGHLTLAQLLVAELLTGSSSQLANVALYSVMPALVGRAGLTDANTRLETTSQMAFLAGPGMAGLLIQAITATRAVIADALSFLAAAVLIGRAPIPPRAPVAEARPPFLTTLREGAAFVFGDPRLRRCALASANSNLGNRVALAVMLLFLYRDVHLTPGEVGVISTGAGVVGPLLAYNAGAVTRRLGLGATLGLSAFLLGAGLASVPLALRLPAVPVVSVAYLLMSVENGLWNVSMITLRQSFTPDLMFGRMVASTRTVAQGTQPVGTLLGGVLGAAVGLVPTIVGGGGLVMATGAYLASPDLWRAGRGDRRLEAPADPSPGR